MSPSLVYHTTCRGYIYPSHPFLTHPLTANPEDKGATFMREQSTPTPVVVSSSSPEPSSLSQTWPLPKIRPFLGFDQQRGREMGDEEDRREEPGLIPGFPDDIAVECLVRVPCHSHSTLRAVCHRWKHLVSSPAFYSRRRLAGAAESLVFLVQAMVSASGGREKNGTGAGGAGKNNWAPPPAYGLNLYNATSGSWHRLLPSASVTVPLFAQCVAVPSARKLVLLGGWNPETFDSVPDVYVVDMVSGAFRKGAPMPSARSFFACAAVGPLVYVAGGHDDQKNALRTAAAYDPVADEWRALPSMEAERDECQGLPCGGRLLVVSGYDTENQGRFERSAESYDPGTGEWTTTDGIWGFASEDGESVGVESPRSCCFVLGERLWHVECGGRRRGVWVFDREERRWKAAAVVPEALRSSTCVGGVAEGKVFLVGSDGEQKHRAWVMDVQARKWAPVDTPAAFSGFAYSAAALQM